MRKSDFLAGFMLMVVTASTAGAATIVVDATFPAFSPDSIRIDVGDIVHWTTADIFIHTTTYGNGSTDAQAGALWDDTLETGVSPTFDRQFNVPGVFPYFCRPHEIDGMKGKIVVTVPNRTDVGVEESLEFGPRFIPKAVTISTGDTVRWFWISGDHTVTSGTGTGDPNMGNLFNQGISSLAPEFKHKFGSNGTIPYFCTLHELDGMNGTVMVVSPPTPPCSCVPCHANPACDAVVDVLDVVGTVAVAFRNGTEVQDPECPTERTDVNCDNVTDVLDVVAVVSVAFRNGNPATVFCNPCA